METIERNGRVYRVEYRYDSDADSPWEDDCGCGNVRKSHSSHCDGQSDKRPGERPLNNASRNEYQFYYDWQEACHRARVDGWNAAPYDAPNRIQRAVQQNFDYCRGYINGNWSYVGVVVTLLDDDGEETDVSESLWQVETYANYHHTVAEELVDECEAQLARMVHQSRVDNRFHDAMECGI